MSAAFYVIGDAESASPWVLGLEGYETQGQAERAIAWQRVGQGAFDPPEYWRVITATELRALLPGMSGSPYTAEAFGRFVAEVTSQAG